MRPVQQLPDIESLPSAFSKRVLKDGAVGITLTSSAALLEAEAFCRYVNAFLTNTGFEYVDRARIVAEDVEVCSSVATSSAGFFSGYDSRSLCSSVGSRSGQPYITEGHDKYTVRLSTRIVNHLVRSFPLTEKEPTAWFRCAIDMHGNSSAPFIRDLANNLWSEFSAYITPPSSCAAGVPSLSSLNTSAKPTPIKTQDQSQAPSPRVGVAWPTLPGEKPVGTGTEPHLIQVANVGSRSVSALHTPRSSTLTAWGDGDEQETKNENYDASHSLNGDPDSMRSMQSSSNLLDGNNELESRTGDYDKLTLKNYMLCGGNPLRGLTLFPPFASREAIKAKLEERANNHLGASSRLLLESGFKLS